MINTLFHCCPKSPNQIEIAAAFKACGFNITTGRNEAADIHVIAGPNWAHETYIGQPNVLMVDRAWWGDGDKGQNKKVSIGWLQANGTRKYATGDAPRPKPELEPWKTREDSCLVLPDLTKDNTIMGRPIEDVSREAAARFTTASVRLHPRMDRKLKQTLTDAIRQHDVVVGWVGTAVFDAIILGVPVICHPQNVCAPVAVTDMTTPLFRGDRTQWLHDMSYRQFSLNEIRSGLALDLLMDAQP
jgi:hypothetical protein